jgi:hypothetical protein
VPPAPRRRRGPRRRDPEPSPPPATFTDVDPTWHALRRGGHLVRTYSPAPYGTRPTTFRTTGPIARFDHHRPDHLDVKGRDRHRGILYAAPTVLCCLGESFGDAGSVTLAGHRVARLDLTADLRLLDLRGPAATGVGTAPGLSAITQRAVTQAWARWLYDHPALAPADGLIYAAFHSGADAVALWERAQLKVRCPRGAHWALDAAAVLPDVEIAADALHLPIF